MSTVEGIQYCGGIIAVHVGDSFSTVGDTFSTVEVVQCSGGITSVQWGDSFSTVEGIDTLGYNISTCQPTNTQLIKIILVM